MPTANQSHAAVLQLIAEGMRSPAGRGLSPEQLRRIATLLDRIAVDLLVPNYEEEEDAACLVTSAKDERLTFNG